MNFLNLVGALMENLSLISLLVSYQNDKMRFAFVTLLIWVNAPRINYLFPTRKCSIKAPAINEDSLFMS